MAYIVCALCTIAIRTGQQAQGNVPHNCGAPHTAAPCRLETDTNCGALVSGGHSRAHTRAHTRCTHALHRDTDTAPLPLRVDTPRHPQPCGVSRTHPHTPVSGCAPAPCRRAPLPVAPGHTAYTAQYCCIADCPVHCPVYCCGVYCPVYCHSAQRILLSVGLWLWAGYCAQCIAIVHCIVHCIVPLCILL